MRRALLFVFVFSICALAADNPRVHLTLDTSEADQVLAILTLRAEGKPIPDAEWQKLFATEPYQRLKAREAAIAKRFNDPTIVLKDEDFKLKQVEAK